MRPQYQQTPFRFVAESIGHIEGLTVSHRTNPNKPLLHYFGGLPYALPPIGPYRFCKPRPLPEYYRYGTRANPGRFTRGTAYCPQPRRFVNLDTSLWDEDCLQLNIYIPAGKKAPPKGWPVFFVSPIAMFPVIITALMLITPVYPRWIPSMGHCKRASEGYCAPTK